MSAQIIPFPNTGHAIDLHVVSIAAQLGCPVPMARAVERRQWIEGEVRLHCERLGLTAADTDHAIHRIALNSWRAWCCAETCVARAKQWADGVAANPMGAA